MDDIHWKKQKLGLTILFFAACLGLLIACSFETSTPADIAPRASPSATITSSPTPIFVLQQTATPDLPHPVPTLRSNTVDYVIQPNDSLGLLAKQYGVTLNQLADVNSIQNADLIYPGQELVIPPPVPTGLGLEYKILSDDLLVNSPAVIDLDIADFIASSKTYLSSYREPVDDRSMTGAEIVFRISQEYSVNPKLLLALLEKQGGWLTSQRPSDDSIKYPMGMKNPMRQGLYRQLAWAADSLNRGFYLWKVNGINTWLLADENLLTVSPVINAGTAAIQYFSSLLHSYDQWINFCGPEGIQQTYINLFGNPFSENDDSRDNADLMQPPLQLPFSNGEIWSFTGGPHGGWGDGSAWAALDFAPPGTELGCFASNHWVVAVSDGLITYSYNGLVIQDVDGDGFPQTGWAIIYQHIESRDRVDSSTYVQAGDPIGHPSCEGGISSGTHVHIARRYNGEWISADGPIPFVLDGWESRGTGSVYDGYLIREGQVVEAWADRRDENQISR